MCRKRKMDVETFLRFSSEEARGTHPPQAYLVGAAYEGTPIKEKALVYVFEGREYLVPFVNVWDGTRVVQSTVRLDKAKRVVARPNMTSQISKMIRSPKIAPRAQTALLAGVKAWFLPERGYRVEIIPFESAEEE